MVRRTLVIAALGATLMVSGCSAVASSSDPTPTPVTAAKVRAAVNNSTLQNAHFVVQGRFQVGVNHDPITGDGTLQRTPKEAFALNLDVQTSSTGHLLIHEVSIGGRDYSRVGNGKWTSKPSTSTASPTAPTTYVGEEFVAGVMTWHARSTDATEIYDIWVREADGYLVLLTLNQANNFISMSFDGYNNSPVITAP
jgi:hypothetical protein